MDIKCNNAATQTQSTQATREADCASLSPQESAERDFAAMLKAVQHLEKQVESKLSELMNQTGGMDPLTVIRNIRQ